MANEEVFSQSGFQSAMDELMKSEKGRQLADQLKTKLKGLNDQFKGLSKPEKERFLKEFQKKFADSLGDLKETLKIPAGMSGDEDQLSSPNDFSPQPNYTLFLLAIFFVVLVFGFFGYKLYKSIMDKEMKKEKKTRKQLKEEKKTQSPPASPRAKKDL